jgi:hypothetical protein
MKTLAAVWCMALMTVTVPAQTPSSQAADRNIYSVALKASILQMEKEYGHMNDSVPGESVRTNYRQMVVEKDPVITDALPTEFDGHAVQCLDSKGMIERYRKLGKSYAILRVRPIQTQANALKIAVVVYWVSYKKHRLQFDLSDWSDVEFRYECEKQEFVISSVKLGGI